MIKVLPQIALELRIDSKDYIEIARNIKRISLIPKSKRENIIKRADKELSGKVRIKLDILNEYMA